MASRSRLAGPGRVTLEIHVQYLVYTEVPSTHPPDLCPPVVVLYSTFYVLLSRISQIIKGDIVERIQHVKLIEGREFDIVLLNS